MLRDAFDDHRRLARWFRACSKPTGLLWRAITFVAVVAMGAPVAHADSVEDAAAAHSSPAAIPTITLGFTNAVVTEVAHSKLTISTAYGDALQADLEARLWTVFSRIDAKPASIEDTPAKTSLLQTAKVRTARMKVTASPTIISFGASF